MITATEAIGYYKVLEGLPKLNRFGVLCYVNEHKGRDTHFFIDQIIYPNGTCTKPTTHIFWETQLPRKIQNELCPEHFFWATVESFWELKFGKICPCDYGGGTIVEKYDVDIDFAIMGVQKRLFKEIKSTYRDILF